MKRDFETDINYQYLLLLLFFVTNLISKTRNWYFLFNNGSNCLTVIRRFYSMLLLPVDSQQLHNNFPRIGDWQRIKNLICFYSYFSVALLAGWLALGPNSFKLFFKQVPFKLYFKAVERIQVRLENNSYWSVVYDGEVWNRNLNLSELPISGWRCFHYVHPILWQLFNIPYP